MKCKRYENEGDIVCKYLVDYAEYLSFRTSLKEIDFPIEDLEKHFSECEDCSKIFRKWSKIFENSRSVLKELVDEGAITIPTLEEVKAELQRDEIK